MFGVLLVMTYYLILTIFYCSCMSLVSHRCLLLFLSTTNLQSVITTVAGGSYFGSSGDGGAATSANFNTPYGIAVDRFENVYIADYGNHKIRMVTSAGIITTFAGTGSSGDSGDNGAATNAQLCLPQAVAVDIASGAVYIADSCNGKIRVVTSNGIITTFAGSGGGQRDNFYDRAAIHAQLVNPVAVAVDRLGNVYIGTGNSNGGGSSSGNQVLFVANGTAYITLLAGCPYCYNSLNSDSMTATNAQLNPVTGLAVDANLNVYIATGSQNQGSNQVFLFTHSAGMISLFAGINYYDDHNGDGGPATSAHLKSPRGLGVDVSGNVYIADQLMYNVRRVANGTGIITTYAGGGANGVALDGDGGPASSADLGSPYGVAIDQNGNVFIAEMIGRIRKVTNSIDYPTSQPTLFPTTMPSAQPSEQPSKQPSRQPSSHPSERPTAQPSTEPSSQPTSRPTTIPSAQPSKQPISRPSMQPSAQPSQQPTVLPSIQPSIHPSQQPSVQPSMQPTTQPSQQPTIQPSTQPSGQPSNQPSVQPSSQPSDQPTGQPTMQPSVQPSR